METEAVRSGYERIVHICDAQRDQFKSIPSLERFVALILPQGSVLDVGCGSGRPVDASWSSMATPFMGWTFRRR